MKNYVPDGRTAENTNLLYFRHGRDEIGFLHDFFLSSESVKISSFSNEQVKNPDYYLIRVVFSLEKQYFIYQYTLVLCNIICNVNCRL